MLKRDLFLEIMIVAVIDFSSHNVSQIETANLSIDKMTYEIPYDKKNQ